MPGRETRPRKILILPGDVHFNLGDTAICASIVGMIRSLIPGTQISVAGRRPIVDGDFEGVHFHRFWSLRLLSVAARADLVLWGGGQLLQGNRSRLKIPIWFLRILAIRMLGKRIVGIGQGLGPLVTVSDRTFSRWAIALTKGFSVRDRDSELEAEIAGVPAQSIQRTADPAILLPKVLSRVAMDADRRSSEEPVRDSPRLGISLRFTLHHRPHRWIPFQYLPLAIRQRQLESSGYGTYLNAMEGLWFEVATKLAVDLVLFPTYLAPWESDLGVAETLATRLSNRGLEVRISHPRQSLADTLGELSQMGAFVGTPMHSTILSTSAGVPTLALYYEPKGLSYLQSLGLERWAFPLDRLRDSRAGGELSDLIVALWHNRAEIRDHLSRSVPDRQRLAARALERSLVPRAEIGSPGSRMGEDS